LPSANIRRICSDNDSDDCLYQDQDAWRWRQAPQRACAGGLTGVAMMTCR
jgi:hypothetical protein